MQEMQAMIMQSYAAQVNPWQPAAYPAHPLPATTALSSTSHTPYPIQTPPAQASLMPHYPAPQAVGSAASGATMSVRYPPNFDTHGGLYAFQPQSGYFLDPVSEYYYDPKSKLYYNASDGTYCYYDASRNPPYAPFQPPLPSSAPSTSTAYTTTDTTSTIKEQEDLQAQAAAALARKPVILSMSGALGSKGSKPIVNRKIATNLAKWESVAQDEDDVAEVGPSAFGKLGVKKLSVVATAVESGASSAPSAAPTAVAINEETVPQVAPSVNLTTAVPTSVAAAPTASGVSASSVCLLCRRQFASPEQLVRHEKESKLHADNLAKQQQQQSTVTSSADPNASVYRDRASERRAVHGDSVPITYPPRKEQESLKRKASIDNYASSSITPASAPSKTLKDDLDNPGNALLRKMGWAEGGLGRDGTGIEEPINPSNRANSKAGVGTGGSGEGGSVGYPRGEGAEYRESLLQATRARFEQVSKQSNNNSSTGGSGNSGGNI